MGGIKLTSRHRKLSVITTFQVLILASLNSILKNFLLTSNTQEAD